MAGFDAFISYSRRASTTLASDLQSAVERFAKPWYRLRAIRVFRDDASMSANTALWSTIERGLIEAEWLVLLASPAAAQSQYVAKEVIWWREHKSPDRILIVLEEGVDIAWSGSDFDFSVTDSLPGALSGAYAEEPRWIDLRWYESSGSLGAQDPRWPERVADIAAAVRMVERDELVGENVRQHRRARRILRTGIAALSLLLVASLVATYVAVGQRSEAQRQRVEAETQRDAAATQARIALARQLAAQAVTLSATDLPTASLLAVQAYRTHEDRQTRAALFQVAAATPELVRALPVGATVTATAVTPDGVVVTGDEDGGVTLWRGGEATPVMTLDGPVVEVAVSDAASVVVAATADQAVRWDGATTTLSGSAPIAVSPDGSTVASSVEDVVTYRVGEAESVVDSFFLATDLSLTATQLLGFSITGDFLAVDLTTGVVQAPGGHNVTLSATTVALSADGSTMVGSVGQSSLPVWQDAAAYDDLADPNATAEAGVAAADIAVTADGGQVASVVEGFVEVATVRAPGDEPVPSRRLAGAGRPGVFGTLAAGGTRWLASGNGSSALVWDLERITRLGSSFVTSVPSPCGACGPGSAEISPDGGTLLVSALGVDSASTVDLDTGVASSLGLADTSVTWGDDGALYALTAGGVARLGTGDPALLGEVAIPEGEIPARLAVGGGQALVATYEGSLITVDLISGRATALTALAAAATTEGGDPVVAPDLSTVAYRSFYTGMVLVVDTVEDVVALELPGIASAYDADSRLHVYNGETEKIVVDGEVVETRPAPNVAESPRPVLDPTGDVLVSGGRDGTPISLLDLRDGGSSQASFVVPQDDDLYPVSAFAPDGTSLVTAIPFLDRGEGLVRTLSLDPEAWIAAACDLAARDLTEADWARYGVGPAPSGLRCVQQ